MKSSSHHSFELDFVIKGKQTNKHKIFGLTGLLCRQTLLRKHWVYLFVLLDVCRCEHEDPIIRGKINKEQRGDKISQNTEYTQGGENLDWIATTAFDVQHIKDLW